MDVINDLGIAYYNNTINELIANGIEPVVTIYQWDLPLPLQNEGGWLTETVVGHFANFANLAFERFGDRVKTWITLNDPSVICWQGYGNGAKAPGISEPAEFPYMCGHNVLKAHGLAYAIYEKFRPIQNGVIGISLDSGWYEPATNSTADFAAAERAIQFQLGWFIEPLTSGKYPGIMRQLVDMKSEQENRTVSRLPEFEPYWSTLLKGSYDFIGLNHFTTNLVDNNLSPDSEPGWLWDQDTNVFQDPSWTGSASSWLKVVPWGFRNLLNWIKDNYKNPVVFVTENGITDDGSIGLEDKNRTEYHRAYINNLLKAVRVDNCSVMGYAVFSLMDNMEWERGFSERFGVAHINFTNPDLPRTPKDSATLIRKIFAENGFPSNTTDDSSAIGLRNICTFNGIFSTMALVFARMIF